MEVVAKRWAPRAVALAVAGFVAWPSLSALIFEREAKPAKPPEPAAVVAASPLPPSPKRDPFDNGERVVSKNARGNGMGGGVDVAGVLARAGAASAASQASSASPQALLSGLRLEATCIMGDRRLAMINGRLYAPQEIVTATGSQSGSESELAKLGYSAPPSKVVDVLPHKVLLLCQGKTLELTYSDSFAGSSPGGGAGRATAPSSKRARSGHSKK